MIQKCPEALPTFIDINAIRRARNRPDLHLGIMRMSAEEAACFQPKGSPMTDAELAAHLAQGAGAILLQVRETGLFSAKALGAVGDELAHRFIAAALAAHRPSDCMISEESADNGDRLGRERVWIVDPLDGTREFSEGRDDWAVHVALAVRGEARDGAVALPALGQLFQSGQAAAASARQPLTILVSRTRPPPQAAKVASRLGGELKSMGSCGAKAMAVLRGEAHIYLHSGGQFEWDSCAPVAVARAAGLHCSLLDGGELRYNKEDLYVPDLLICHAELAAPVLEALRQ